MNRPLRNLEDDPGGAHLRERIAQAKELLTLEDLITEVGDWNERVELGLCPFHADHKPSFSLFAHSSGDLWKCHAGCGAGHQIRYLEVKFQLPRYEAILLFLEMAGLANQGGGRFRR